MLSYRLVRMIETHADELAAALLEATRNSDKTKNYVETVGEDDLKQRVAEIYQQLDAWLTGTSESDIERRYTEIGEYRAQQGVPLRELLWAIFLVKDVLIEFLKKESVPERPFEVFGELEMLQLLEQFSDRAAYWAAVGHERGTSAKMHSKTV
jgi:hypothetical protein